MNENERVSEGEREKVCECESESELSEWVSERERGECKRKMGRARGYTIVSII